MLPTISAALLLSACAAFPTPGPYGKAASLRLGDAVRVGAAGSVAIQPRSRTLAQAAPSAILPFAAQHLVRVDVYLESPGHPAFGSPQLMDSLVAGDLDRRIELLGLDAGVKYTITLKAWQPEDANDATSLVEAQVDALSRTVFTAEADKVVDLDAAGGIKLTLRDRGFEGRAPGDFLITPGTFSSTEEAEGIVTP